MSWDLPQPCPAEEPHEETTVPSEKFRTAVVLAGGASERMAGRDKQALDDGGKPLTVRILERLGSVFLELAVVTNRPELYRSFPGNLHTLQDRVPGFGPLSGLHAALAGTVGDWVYLTACDMPEFDLRWIGLLASAIVDSEQSGGEPVAALAGYKSHMEPFQAFYSRRLIPHIERSFKFHRPSDRAPSISSILEGLPCLCIPEGQVRRLYPDWSLFRNINTPMDWESYLGGRGESLQDGPSETIDTTR